MSHSYSYCLFHCVWSTQQRQNSIPPDVQAGLWPYMGGIARQNGFATVVFGGTPNHVHALLSLPATMPVAKAIQLTKAGSSKWLHDNHPELRRFAWQEGYGAFSIGVSQLDDTKRYISRQAEHHAVRGFEDEYTAFLRRHQIEYDPRYVFG